MPAKAPQDPERAVGLQDQTITSDLNGPEQAWSSLLHGAEHEYEADGV